MEMLSSTYSHETAKTLEKIVLTIAETRTSEETSKHMKAQVHGSIGNVNNSMEDISYFIFKRYFFSVESLRSFAVVFFNL